MMEEDKGSIWWGILGFCLPVVGLILFIIWNQTKKKSAKQAGIGALIRVIISFIVAIVIMFLFFFFAFNTDSEKNCMTMGLDGKESIVGGIKVCCDEEGNCEVIESDIREIDMKDKIKLLVNEHELIVELENNTSVDALLLRLKEGDIVINAHDYGNFEKVGDLGFDLPSNDKYITTEPGDLILYQGNQITLYYDTNSYSFTKLGKVVNVSGEELKDILGSGDVTIVIEGKEE